MRENTWYHNPYRLIKVRHPMTEREDPWDKLIDEEWQCPRCDTQGMPDQLKCVYCGWDEDKAYPSEDEYEGIL